MKSLKLLKGWKLILVLPPMYGVQPALVNYGVTLKRWNVITDYILIKHHGKVTSKSVWQNDQVLSLQRLIISNYLPIKFVQPLKRLIMCWELMVLVVRTAERHCEIFLKSTPKMSCIPQ